MYKIVGDIEPRSFWLVTTPSASQRTMPYLCTEAGTLYGKQKFLTERDGKDSYLLFYTFGGTGFVRQNNHTITVRHGQMLLMDCRTPQAYGTASSADHWYHHWAHVEGAGVEATAKRLGLPVLTPISVSRSRIQPHFDAIIERLEAEGVENGEIVGLAVHNLLSGLLIARARANSLAPRLSAALPHHPCEAAAHGNQPPHRRDRTEGRLHEREQLLVPLLTDMQHHATCLPEPARALTPQTDGTADKPAELALL